MKQDFKDLANTAVVNYKDRNFCTVAALAMTLDWSFGKAHRHMAKAGRKTGRGMFISAWRPAIEAAAESAGKRFKQGHYHILGDGRTMTLKRFCKEYPTGTYYIQVNQHALAIVDGVMHDWTANTAGRRKIHSSFKLIDGE